MLGEAPPVPTWTFAPEGSSSCPGVWPWRMKPRLAPAMTSSTRPRGKVRRPSAVCRPPRAVTRSTIGGIACDSPTSERRERAAS